MATATEIIAELTAQVAETVAGEQSAIVALNGVTAAIDAAVAAALANGATAEQMAPVSDLSASLKASAAALAAAIPAQPVSGRRR